MLQSFNVHLCRGHLRFKRGCLLTQKNENVKLELVAAGPAPGFHSGPVIAVPHEAWQK